MCLIGVAKANYLFNELDFTKQKSEKKFQFIDFNFSNCQKLGEKIYEDTTSKYVEFKCSKSVFLSTIKEILSQQYEIERVFTLYSFFENSLKENTDREQYFRSKGLSNDPEHFKKRNTYFYIYSLTGRSIKKFSNFQNETEVLFAPYSTFLVCKHIKTSNLTEIYLRQIDLGLNKNTVLWVDDQILNQDWENKALMEKFTSENGFQKNLHIIPKSSTKLALSFLDSEIGKFLKGNEGFQFISDMSRPFEKNGKEAGALFAKEVRNRGFCHKILIYTSNKKTAEELLIKHLGNLKNIFVTQIQMEAIEYVYKNI